MADRTYGNLRLHFDGLAIELDNSEKSICEAEDDMSCFSCRQIHENDPYIPFVLTDTKTVAVDAVVSSVEIKSDLINLNHGQTEYDFDSAIVFKTNKGEYIFARAQWFSEVIFTDYNKDYDTIFPVEKVVESWSNDGLNAVSVKRTSIELKSK